MSGFGTGGSATSSNAGRCGRYLATGAVAEFAPNFGTNATPSRFACGGVQQCERAIDGRGGSLPGQLENLAAAYLRLAEQAERNSGLTIEFDPISEKENPKRKP
jgi:hypothetical protein